MTTNIVGYYLGVVETNRERETEMKKNTKQTFAVRVLELVSDAISTLNWIARFY